MKTVIIGLGNPILSDDSVGIKVAREMAGRLDSLCDGVDVRELYAGGIRLLDALEGYGRAIIVDAMVTGTAKPGDIHRLTPEDMTYTRNSLCLHDMDICTALEMGRMVGLQLPRDIKIWGIEADDVETFSEELTAGVAGAVPLVVGQICDEIGMAVKSDS